MRHILREGRSSHVSRDRWLVSYADFMTLLFAFFATMYAISSVDAHKLSTVAQAMKLAFDNSSKARPQPAGSGVLPDSSVVVSAVSDRTSAEVREAVSRDLAAELASEQLQLIVDRRGVTLSIPESGTFATGSDELSDAAQALVVRVATALNNFPNAVRVEGHTDDLPIHTIRFSSNWDLSAARASRVVEFLIGRGIQAGRLSATGYGEFHPRAANTSAAARASNRRIDLVILNAATTSAEEPAAPGRAR